MCSFSDCFALVVCVLNSFCSCDRLYSHFWPRRIKDALDTCKRTDSVRSAFLCAINSLFCINFQMSLLIPISSNFCHCTLKISPLPVIICSIRSGYFSLCFFCFLSVVLAALCKKLIIPFLSFSNLTGAAIISSILMYITCSYVRFVRVSDVLPVKNCCGFMCFTKFCFATASEQISGSSKFISLLPYKGDLISDFQLKRLSSPSYKKAIAVMFMMTIKLFKM